jgi:transcription antitermination factor NusG
MLSGMRDNMTTHRPGLQWYAIRTRSRFEKVVRDQLLGRGLEPLLPLRAHVSQWKDRKKLIEWPLFPCYCFARFILNERLTVLQVPGVVQIIGSGAYAEPIPDEEIAALQRMMQSRETYEPYPYHLVEGTIVQVIRGPLTGIRGRFVRTASSTRLVIAINLIQQAASVVLDAHDVAVANDIQPELIHPH